jgi:hypothetical protein
MLSVRDRRLHKYFPGLRISRRYWLLALVTLNRPSKVGSRFEFCQARHS